MRGVVTVGGGHIGDTAGVKKAALQKVADQSPLLEAIVELATENAQAGYKVLT